MLIKTVDCFSYVFRVRSSNHIYSHSIYFGVFNPAYCLYYFLSSQQVHDTGALHDVTHLTGLHYSRGMSIRGADENHNEMKISLVIRFEFSSVKHSVNETITHFRIVFNVESLYYA